MLHSSLTSEFSVSATPDGFVSLQVGSNVCFYVSTSSLWPFESAWATDADNKAAQNCSNLDLPLAVIKNNAERIALWNLLRQFIFVRNNFR